MRTRTAFLATYLLALSPASAGVRVGDPMTDIRLPNLLHAEGADSLHDLLDRPVVIMEWATGNANSIQYGVATSRGLHEKYAAKGLVVVLLESSSGSEIADIEAFLMREAPGPRLPLCGAVNLGVEREGEQFIPRFVVIGVDGTLVEEGVLWNEGKELETAVKSEMAKLKAGWGTDRSIRKARALLHGKGDVAGARAAWAALADGDAPGDEVDALKMEIDRRLERLRVATEHHLESGECARAVAALDALATATSGVAAWEEPVAALRARTSGATFAAEVALEKKLTKITRGFAKKRPKASVAKKLEKLADEVPGSSVARRARRLADRVARATSG